MMLVCFVGEATLSSGGGGGSEASSSDVGPLCSDMLVLLPALTGGVGGIIALTCGGIFMGGRCKVLQDKRCCKN